MEAKHTYEDWVRHCETGNVGIIITGSLKTNFTIKWYGEIECRKNSVYDFDFITEYEYYKVVDPKRCGTDIRVIIPSECLFTGKMIKFPEISKPSEDFFS